MDNLKVDAELIEAEQQAYTVKPLWHPNSIMILSIVFSPIFAMILYILNYHRLKDTAARNMAIAGYVLISGSIIGAILLTPPEFSRVVFGINLGIGIFLKSKQTKIFAEHLERGGKKAGMVVPTVISLVITGIFAFFAIYTLQIPDDSKAYFNDEIYYTSSVTVEEVDQLANFLESLGFFAEDEMPVSVKLDQVGGVYQVYFPIVEDYINDADLNGNFAQIQEELNSTLYKDNGVVVHMSNEVFKVLKSFGK